MNVSLNWLSEYVAHGLDADALDRLLTMAGLEVESVERTGPVLEGVVVGHVLGVRPHPNADRLRVCDVDLGGSDGPVQIVCGAPNVAEGQAVPVATVGTELMLPARDGSGVAPVTIQKGKIRGEVSNGMICAEDELGLGTDHDGILVLDPDAPVGLPLASYLAERGDLPGDAVLDVSITPNRPDATSHLGVARDVAALTGQALSRPDVDVPAAGGDAADQVSVTIEDADGCPRYVGMIVRGVTVGPSPDWLRERLEAVGVRSVNNVVDVTNYVLHEVGQPLHAFDLNTLAGPAIVVRASRAGEALTTLDDQKRDLPTGTLLICDAEQPVAVAGVMGGATSEVTDATTDVLIESATFDPSRVRRASKALGLQTDASYRFERGVDPTAQAWAAARAAALLVEVAGGTLVPGLIDANPVPYEPRTVTVRPARVAAVLGVTVPTEEITRLLTAIGFQPDATPVTTFDAFAEAAMREEGVAAAVREAAETGLTFTVPPFRPDVAREIDAIEEVARLWGYDRLPLPTTTPIPLVPAGDTPAARRLDATRARLAALGFREVYTNSLLSRGAAEAFALEAWTGRPGTPVETLHPISQEMAALRPSLLPGLLAVAAYNQARGAGPLRLMEAGHVMLRADDPAATVDGYHEHTAFGIAMSGEAEAATWDRPARDADVYDLKGVVAAVLEGLGVTDVEETPRATPDALTAYAVELAAGGVRIGIIARVADAVADAHDLQAPLFAAELDWDAVARLAGQAGPVTYAPFARAPAVERDVAVVVPQDQPAGPLLATIRQAGRPLLTDVRLFDRYRGERVEAGHQSLAFALRFAGDRTLTDKEVDGRMRRITSALKREHGAMLRG